MWTPVGWDTLLNFDTDHQDGNSNLFDFTPGPSSGSAAAPSGSGSAMARIKSDPGRDRPEAHGHGHGHGGGHSSGGKAIAGPASLEPARMAHGGSDLAWKTILASQVDVEGVGQVGVARVLQEVWKRGGGEQVSFLIKIPLETPAHVRSLPKVFGQVSSSPFHCPKLNLPDSDSLPHQHTPLYPSKTSTTSLCDTGNRASFPACSRPSARKLFGETWTCRRCWAQSLNHHRPRSMYSAWR